MQQRKVPFPRDQQIHATDDICSVGISRESNKISASQPGFQAGTPCPQCATLNTEDVLSFLNSEMETLLLDELHPWLLYAAPYGPRGPRHIDPLHAQLLKGRKVMVAEDANLHLTWSDSTIYLKPIPSCLLKFDIWSNHLGFAPNNIEADPLTPVLPQVLGFLRSCAALLKHPVDFQIAKDSKLLPVDVNWQRCWQFLSNFRGIDDAEVAHRYWFGQLRHSRLDWLVRLLQPQLKTHFFYYHLRWWSIGPYLTTLTVPLAFLFASVGIALSAMQVIIAAVSNLGVNDNGKGFVYDYVWWTISVIVLLAIAACWIIIVGIPTVVVLWQLVSVFSNRKLLYRMHTSPKTRDDSKAISIGSRGSQHDVTP